MNQTIKNMSQLEEALSRMSTSSHSSPVHTPRSSTPITPGLPLPNVPHQYSINIVDPISEYSTPPPQTKLQSSAARTATSQTSTSGLLLNIAGIQTSTNNKIDKLADAIYRLHNSIEILYKEQAKQTELLGTIARNTAGFKNVPPTQVYPDSLTPAKGKVGSIREYGFSNAEQLFSEFLLKLLKQIDIQAGSKGKRYKSTRDLTSKLCTQIVKAAMKHEFKVKGNIEGKIDANGLSHPSLYKVAGDIGSKVGIDPILTPEAFREIFDDVDCKFFVNNFLKIVERLKVIKVLIPYYEADIICAMEYPYFNKSGEAMCNWNALNPRDETPIETKVMNAAISTRSKLAEYLAKGLSERSAISATLQQ